MREYPSSRLDLWALAKGSVRRSSLGYDDDHPVYLALEMLTPIQAEILAARLFESLTWEEMADRFNTPRTSIQRRYDKVLKLYRHYYGELVG